MFGGHPFAKRPPAVSGFHIRRTGISSTVLVVAAVCVSYIWSNHSNPLGVIRRQSTVDPRR